MSESKNMTCFSEKLDKLARERGGWDDAAVVYEIECVNADQVLVTGAVPSGHKRNGRLVFPPKSQTFKAVVTIGEYRAALSRAEGR
jgi:hypothetical protein